MTVDTASYFSVGGEPSFRAMSLVAPSFWDFAYPMEYMTALHKNLHIPSFTHAWMDAFPFGGSYHRVLHGHDLFIDGYKVLVNPEYSFGAFLRHLGCDFFTKTGVPIPGLARMLTELGMAPKLVTDFCSINLPKVLGGSLSLVVSGPDVWAMFSDTIPHTFTDAALHAGLAVADLVIGSFPPNPLILLSGAGEAVVAAATAYRAWTEPVVEMLGVPMNVYLEGLGSVLPLAAAFAAGGCLLSGKNLDETVKTVTAAVIGHGAAYSVGAMAAGGGLSSLGVGLGAMMGPAAGIATFFLAKRLFDALGESERRAEAFFKNEATTPVSDWSGTPSCDWSTTPNFDWRGSSAMHKAMQPSCSPGFLLPTEPIGSLKDGTLSLNNNYLRSRLR